MIMRILVSCGYRFRLPI
uniref:Uncharacterized protein n=1 Tax=Arundo donax TaxID=35708 RepID=A0A0A9GUW9_ARUDO